MANQRADQRTGFWALPEAALFVEHAITVARRHGYLLGLYGSTLTKGRGKDLDLLAVPWRPNTHADHFIREFAAYFNGWEEGPRYEGLMKTLAVVIKLPSGKLVDLQVRYS